MTLAFALCFERARLQARRKPRDSGRWEAGISPISLMTMSHLRKLVEVKIMNEARHLFDIFKGRLPLIGTPHTALTEDNNRILYLGTYSIDGYRKHLLYLRINDRQWYGLDGEKRAVIVDEDFVKSVVLAVGANPTPTITP